MILRLLSLFAAMLLAAPAEAAPPSPRPIAGALGLHHAATTISETNPAGDLLVEVESARMLGATFSVRFLPPEPLRSRLTSEDWSPYWRAELSAYSMAYVLTDVNLPFSYRFREDTRLEGAIMREVSREHLLTEVGLGYFARVEEAFHTGAPPDLSQAFTFNRLFHGPMLKLAFALPPEEVVIGGVRGWKLFAEADFAPWLATDLDRGLPPLPALGFNRTTVGLERDMGPIRARFAYGQWRMTGQGFDERWGVPSLTLTWTTDFPDASVFTPKVPPPLAW